MQIILSLSAILKNLLLHLLSSSFSVLLFGSEKKKKKKVCRRQEPHLNTLIFGLEMSTCWKLQTLKVKPERWGVPAGCSRLPALLTVAAAHPVAAACSEANCFWNFSLGVASCAVCVLWIPGNWLMMERLRNITTQEPAVSLFPLAVSNFKNKTKTFL